MKKSVLLVLILASLSFVSALEIMSVTPDYANRTIETTFNFTFNNTAGIYGNITDINITFPAGATFVIDSNYTEDEGILISFENLTDANANVVLVWSNSSDGIIDNETEDATTQTHSFIFNATSLNTAGSITFTVNVTYTGGANQNQTTYTTYVYFDFDGYVKNETGDYQNNTNVSFYRFDESTGGPPTETLLDSVLSNDNGFFSFLNINGSSSFYKINLVYYNETDSSIELANATKTGTILPPFPANMFYPLSAQFDMQLNGTTFYLQEASTINLTATNSTGDYINFGYEVTDQLLGFPIDSNVLGNVSTKQVIIPTGRDYTVMMVRDFSQFPTGADCDGTIHDDAGNSCPAPPKSTSITLNTTNQGQIHDVSINLTVSKIYVYGCVNPAEGNNDTGINVTNIIPRLLPWAGFVITSMKADDGSINITDVGVGNLNINNTEDVRCSAGDAFYNLSLLGSSEYMLEFYAKNASDEAGHPAGAWDLAAFQNISTTTSDLYQNITLYRLAGEYNETSERNTSLMTINIQNSTGDANTKKIGLVSVKIKNPVFGTTSYIIESLSDGAFTLPILNNSDWAKVFVFADDSPPIERSINLTNATNSIRLSQIDYSSGGDKGLRTTNSTGDFVTLNASSLNLELKFYSTRSGCDLIDPPETCLITEMNASDFNPLKALVAGKVNMKLKFTTSNVSLLFHNYDMFSAKQPPMFSVINAEPANATSGSQLWEFGSFAPSDSYKNVTIAMPYSDVETDFNYINESLDVKISLSVLYVEDPNNQNAWQLAWNNSRGDTDANLTDELLDYNQSAFSTYLTTGGATCTKDYSESLICYHNTTGNIIYMTIPHFSGASPSASAPAGTAAAAAAAAAGAGQSQTVEVWSKTITLTDEQFSQGITESLGKNERIRFLIEGKYHQVGVKDLTADSVTITVASEPQTATLSIGDEKKFDVTDDKYYDVSVKLEKIGNNIANLTIKSIHEEVVEEKVEEAEEEKKVEEKIVEEAKKLFKKTWFLAIIALIIIAIIIYFVYKKTRYYKKGY